MGQFREFVPALHTSTTRDYLERMVNDKVACMRVAKEYEADYWDGDRKFGYGGYRFLPGRWKPVAEKLIETYGLGPQSRLLDVGCGKGYLLHEIKNIIGEINIVGIDISQHGIDGATSLIRPYLQIHDAKNPLPFDRNSFDLVISLGTLHNFRLPELQVCLAEIERVGRQGYVMVESYRNDQELFNLQCWALTAETFLDADEWKWLMKHFDYTGDYEFIYFD